MHEVAEREACLAACWRAIRQPQRVQRLVLVSPPEPPADLVERLDEIQAETLIVVGIADDPAHLYQQHIPRAHRVVIYAPQMVTKLVADFLRRGQAFVVKE